MRGKNYAIKGISNRSYKEEFYKINLDIHWIKMINFDFSLVPVVIDIPFAEIIPLDAALGCGWWCAISAGAV